MILAAHPKPRPQICDDLFELYGLTGLAAEVARVKPNGEKNAIRKTYKGHIKKLGVQGSWEEIKSDANHPESLLGLMKCPSEEWNVRFVANRDINEGFNADIKAKLTRATTMGKGLIPRTTWDSSVLGEVAPGKFERAASSTRPTAPNTPLVSAVSGAGIQRTKAHTPMTAQDAARPKRNVKKRGYGDSSFDGYGEGFPDDDGGAETGYSTGEGEMASGLKRRKKVLISGFGPD